MPIDWELRHEYRIGCIACLDRHTLSVDIYKLCMSIDRIGCIACLDRHTLSVDIYMLCMSIDRIGFIECLDRHTLSVCLSTWSCVGCTTYYVKHTPSSALCVYYACMYVCAFVCARINICVCVRNFL